MADYLSSKPLVKLMYCSAGRAYTFAKSGKYPWKKYPIVRRLRDASGLYWGEIVPVQWVAIPQERVTGVFVEWKFGGDIVRVHHWDEPKFHISLEPGSREDRAVVRAIIGNPDEQARTWSGWWKFLKELSPVEIQKLAALKAIGE